MKHPEYQYLDLLRDCLENGAYREGRNGGTFGLFGRQIRFDLSQGFPLLTTKRIFTKAVVTELLWFLKGSTNIGYLHDNGVTIWDEWADENGNLGPVYGAQWRFWMDYRKATFIEGPHEEQVAVTNDGFAKGSYVFGTIDQIYNVIQGLKQDPYGRRHIVTAWNPADIPHMALPPCHCLFQFFVQDGKLSCQLYQRSADIFLGVPFNIASYALLTHLIARAVDLEVGEFVHTFGDVHLYENHVEQAKEQLSREPREFPQLVLGSARMEALRPEDVTFDNYNPHPTIKAPVSA